MEDARAYSTRMRIFLISERKQMRLTMNRIVYQPNPGCACTGTAAARYSAGRTQQVHGVHPAAEMTDGCGCGTGGAPLAMAYVRIQPLGNLYDPCTALIAGTLFADLDLPFCGEVVSSSAYPTPPARSCSCTLSGNARGGHGHE